MRVQKISNEVFAANVAGMNGAPKTEKTYCLGRDKAMQLSRATGDSFYIESWISGMSDNPEEAETARIMWQYPEYSEAECRKFVKEEILPFM